MLDAAPLISVLFARAPEMCPNAGEDFYMMDLVNRWLSKELRLGLTSSVWPVKS
jgi:hypothetical protein